MLVKELRDTVKEIKGFTFIAHPLLHTIYFRNKEEDKLYNSFLKTRKEALHEAEVKHDYHGAIWLHQRPYRLQALLNYWQDILKHSPEGTLEELIMEVWVDCENPHVNLSAWKTIFSEFPIDKTKLMSEDDLKAYNNLAGEFVIYRGATSKRGISWTLSKDIAEWFAKRFNRNGKVFERIVSKDDIICYSNIRSEHEIIYLGALK